MRSLTRFLWKLLSEEDGPTAVDPSDGAMRDRNDTDSVRSVDGPAGRGVYQTNNRDPSLDFWCSPVACLVRNAIGIAFGSMWCLGILQFIGRRNPTNEKVVFTLSLLVPTLLIWFLNGKARGCGILFLVWCMIAALVMWYC